MRLKAQINRSRHKWHARPVPGEHPWQRQLPWHCRRWIYEDHAAWMAPDRPCRMYNVRGQDRTKRGPDHVKAGARKRHLRGVRIVAHHAHDAIMAEHERVISQQHSMPERVHLQRNARTDRMARETKYRGGTYALADSDAQGWGVRRKR